MNDNITPPDGYRHTGNAVPIDGSKLLNYVVEQLSIYDNLVQHGKHPSSSPYEDPVLFATDDKKLVQVPQEIQEKAVTLWKNKQTMPQPIVEEQKEEKQEESKQEKSLTNIILFIIAVILFLGYNYYKNQ